ncbi:MAG: redox-regulated ATPase YchF [Sedimentisphaerales bacterium]|nr:redox-regulated ATPase YchF [Sedimentisphaerales bacterium]
MKVALIGLMQSGKSTLFSAISGKAMLPVGTTTIEQAVVASPDERIDWLTKLYKPKKTVYATIDCLDVPGFNFADEHGRTAARRFIEQVRTVDMLALIIGAFEETSKPVKDLNYLKTELLLSDLALISTRIEKLEKESHKPGKAHERDKAELELQKKLHEAIESEKSIRSAIANDAEMEMVKSLGFLTLKPMVIAVNLPEGQLDEKFDFGLDTATPVISVCAKLEYELSQLDAESRQQFMADLGITESAAGKFVHACYRTLGLISFLTVCSNEVHAWPVKQGTIAHDAAGKVHSDIKRGFIRAETFCFDDIKQLGSEKALKAAGKIRLEGKEYVVRDGDVINFRFNV